MVFCCGWLSVIPNFTYFVGTGYTDKLGGKE
jgi:hypothetical protein